MRGRYATLKRKHQEINDKSEQEVWRWYWEVKHTTKHYRQKKSLLWRHYNWMFENEKFDNKKSEAIYDLFIPNNIKV